ncbi:MAG: hypothetical protein JO023_16315 [Chloroflexi bacterium]|nr:hypothetical protein [Chloroflexota bacterium]
MSGGGAGHLAGASNAGGLIQPAATEADALPPSVTSATTTTPRQEAAAKPSM